MDPVGAADETMRLFRVLGALLDFSESEVNMLVAVFARVGAMAALLPGFGEQAVPPRVRLAVALAFTAVVWPLVTPALSGALAPGGTGPIQGLAAPPFALGRLILAETAAGLALGLAVRFVLMALQFAGSIAAQATSVLQIFGGGVTPDPMPAIGNILTMAGIALALALDLHIKAALAVAASYQVLPFGVFPVAGDLGAWGLARASSTFALAFGLATPFLAMGLIYNLALGAINRAMPQLMVALVGAPAITGAALLILALAAPALLVHWSGALDAVLANPFGAR